MRMMYEQLNESEATPAVWFNAWRFQQEEHLILPLLETVRMELLNRPGVWEETGNFVGKLATALVEGLSFGLPGGLMKWEAGKSLEAARDMKAEVGGASLYFDAMRYLDQAMKAHREEDPERRIVVFIDDMDRCLHEKALGLLEGTKTFLDVDGLVFVMGLDRRVFEEFVKTTKFGWMGDDTRERLGLLANPDTRDGAVETLKTGTQDDDADIRSISERILREHGIDP